MIWQSLLDRNGNRSLKILPWQSPIVLRMTSDSRVFAHRTIPVIDNRRLRIMLLALTYKYTKYSRAAPHTAVIFRQTEAVTSRVTTSCSSSSCPPNWNFTRLFLTNILTCVLSSTDAALVSDGSQPRRTDAITSSARRAPLTLSFPLLASFLATPLLGGDVTQRRRSRVSPSDVTDSGCNRIESQCSLLRSRSVRFYEM